NGNSVFKADDLDVDKGSPHVAKETESRPINEDAGQVIDKRNRAPHPQPLLGHDPTLIGLHENFIPRRMGTANLRSINTHCVIQTISWGFRPAGRGLCERGHFWPFLLAACDVTGPLHLARARDRARLAV
ncbi:hypothetical protein BaRGS_00007487, partial [Batillaria attramentaria]